MFALAAVWSYFFLRSYYNGFNNFVFLAFLTVLLFLARSDAGLFFVFFFFLLVLVKVFSGYGKTVRVVLVEVFASGLGVVPDSFVNKTLQIFDHALKNFWEFNPKAFFFAFSNPVYIFASFLVLFSRDLLHIVLVLVTLLASFLIGNVAFIFGELSFRYLFSLMPLHLFFLGKVVSGQKWLLLPFSLLGLWGVVLFLFKVLS